MPELRKHYLLENFVIIATERGKRPHDFNNPERKISPKKTCPLCPENEYMIPRMIEEEKENGTWFVRSIENKFKAVGHNTPFIRTDNEFYTFGNAYGDHEVIIETPIHGVEFEELSEERIKKAIEMIIRRVEKCYEDKNAKYVVVFKNRGEEAAASLSHSHHQIISLNIIPQEIKDESNAIKNYKSKNRGACPMCKVIHSEKNSDRRISQDEKFVAFSPYASRFCFEAWVMPKRCVYSITELDDAEIASLSHILKKVLTRLDSMNYPAYNLFYKMGNRENPDFHFRIEIAPRLAKWAGFEYTSGVIINAVTPENAAIFYREE